MSEVHENKESNIESAKPVESQPKEVTESSKQKLDESPSKMESRSEADGTQKPKTSEHSKLSETGSSVNGDSGHETNSEVRNGAAPKEAGAKIKTSEHSKLLETGSSANSDSGHSTKQPETSNGNIETLNSPKNKAKETESSTDDSPEKSEKKTDATKNPEKMEKPIELNFKCNPPKGLNEDEVKAYRNEFNKQLKGQEDGINKQSVAENMANRSKYQERKEETGSGRDPEGSKAQREFRNAEINKRTGDLAEQYFHDENFEKGKSVEERKSAAWAKAKEDAKNSLKGQDALHDPDQVAGGDPTKIKEFGDRSVNRSIGKQWDSNAPKLAEATDQYAKEHPQEDLSKVKMNVKLNTT